MTTYTYSISENFTNHDEIDTVKLCQEINESSSIGNDKILVNVDISEPNDLLTIYFEHDLTSEEELALNAIISGHVVGVPGDIEYIEAFNMTDHQIKNLGDPTNLKDAVHKQYTDQNIQNAKDYTDYEISALHINNLTGAPVGSVVGTTDAQNLTNKQMNAFENSIINISNSNIHSDAGINATKIAYGNVTNEEFDRLSGLTSNAQNQITSNAQNIDLHTTNQQNPHNVTKQQVGLGNVHNTKSKFDAVINPSVLNDGLGGYTIGSLWINTVTEKSFVCVDDSEGQAKWVETTSMGEIIQNINVGTGEGIYLEKIDSTHKFKSLQGSVNVTLQPGANEITIHSRDSHSFLLCPVMLEAIKTTYSTIILFPWLHSEFNTYKNGKLIFEAVIDKASMGIQIINVSGNAVLGSIDPIEESGFYSLTIANPPENARLKIQIKKSEDKGDFPKIFGLILKYES